MTDPQPTHHKQKAILGVLTAAALWGISGTCAQFLFQQKQINAEWLVTVRLIAAGFLLLGCAQTKSRQSFMAIWKKRRDAASLILFSLLGMLAVQYTYFAAILHSNAATATILQYLGPAIIAVYLAVQQKRLPSRIEAIAVLFALAGTFFIVTHGNVRSLSITDSALFWGIASAFALAFYTVQPLSLLKRWGSAIVVGWGMLLGGIAFSTVHAPWNFVGRWDAITGMMVAFIIIFGSLIPFSLFMSSVKILGATDSSILACAEPLSAAVVAVLWLKVRFGVYDWIGTILILTTILLLTLKDKQASAPLS